MIILINILIILIVALHIKNTLVNIKVSIQRNMTETSTERESQKNFHLERAKLIHSLVDTLDLKVKDWGITDANIDQSHEWDDMIIAFGSAGIFSAAVTAFQIWLNRKKISDVRIAIKKAGKETEISLRHATEKDIKSIIRSLKLK
jgi:hypothetical protein